VRVPQTDLTIVSEAAKEEEMKNAGIFSVIINKVNLLANLCIKACCLKTSK